MKELMLLNFDVTIGFNIDVTIGILKHKFNFQKPVGNGCHDYRCIISGISKSNATDLLINCVVDDFGFISSKRILKMKSTIITTI